MTDFTIEDFARTTLGGAEDRATGMPLSAQQLDEVITYLKSPGSGPDSATSFADYMAAKLKDLPPELPPGTDYVGFSGKDSAGKNNYQNALQYILDVDQRAGIIGNTPLGEYLSDVEINLDRHPDFKAMASGLEDFMTAQGTKPYGKDYPGALRDMMWNAGSPRYFENAIATGKPLLAFVENAPANRGFSNFELTTALEHPNARINGYPVSAFGPDPLAFVSQSAAEYQALERTLAQHATANGTEAVTVAKLRADLMPIEGYDALGKTLYARPLDDFKTLSLDDMTRVRVEWVAARGTLPAGPHLVADAPEPHRAPGQPGAPRGPPNAATAAEVVAEAAPHRAPGGIGPGMKVAGVAGLALMAHDFGTSGHKWVELKLQGNDAGADSTAAHFVGRNVGGALGGFVAGAGVGLATGSWTGPGAIITGIGGGAFGAYLGESWAKQKDIERVYTQEDSLGRAWQRDPADPEGRWYRGAHQQQVQSGDLGTGVEVRPVQNAQGDDVTFQSRYVATGTLERQLNHQAAKASYELGLTNRPTPRDPYRLDASAETYPPRAPFETGRDYVRDARSGEWMLEIQRMIDGRVPINHREPVDPERLPMLDEQSRTIIAQNAANTPASLAARYMVAHEQQRWDDFGTRDNPAVPPAIQDARDNPNTLQASNGQTYTRQEDGQWLHNGMLFNSTANVNLRDELEVTWQSQEAGVQGLSQMADQIWKNRQLEPEGVRGQLEDLYTKHGIERTPQQLDATAAAVQQQLAQSGKPEYVTLELMPDPRTHGPSTDSAIAAFSDDGGNRMVLQSTTTVEDVARHQAQLAAAPAPAQNSEPAMLDAVTVTAPRAEHAKPSQALLPNHPDHPDHPAYDKIHKWVQGTGNWNEEQSHNVAASLYRKQAENPAFQRVDRVTGALGPNGEHNVIATYAPHGDTPPFFNAVVDGREAMLQPAHQNLEQAEVAKQEQVRQQGREQAPPAMHM